MRSSSQRLVSAVALLAMIACVLADAALRLDAARQAARWLLFAYVVLEWRLMAGNARMMIAIAAAMTLTYGLLHGSPVQAIAGAMDQGTFFATFFANQFFLREAARTSPLVHRCSSFFINQPPKRRYALLTLGGYLFGIIVNLGVLSLLGSMIKRRNTLAAANGNEEVRAARERRMALALLRGFSVTPLASPLSLSLAIMLTALPSLQWTIMLPLGMASGALILGLGCLHDWATAPRHLAGQAPKLVVVRDYAALAGVTAIVLAVLGCALTLEALLRVPLSRAILVSLPLVGLVWLAVQYRRFGAVKAARLLGRRVVRRATRTFPAYRTEIAILSSAGFIGSLFAAFVPPETLAAMLTAPWMPPLALAPVLLLAVFIAGLGGINPIVAVTILASSLKAAPPLPVPLEPLALALMIGWSLSINRSALTASAMLTADMFGKSPSTIVGDWNGGFSLMALLAAVLWLVALAAVFPGA